jgi:type IV fimbrial biogenesis protein FimT
MKTMGFTLIELFVVILILTILAVSAIPSFQQNIQNIRTRTAKNELLEAIEQTRAMAVFSGSRSILKAKDRWHNGWEIFLDKDNNGIAGDDEPILLDHPSLAGVTITGNDKVINLISFISTGEGRAPGAANAGAFIAGTLTICPANKGKGYKLVLSRGGRTRTEEISARHCS